MTQPYKVSLNGTELVSGHNCFVPTALEQMIATKNLFNKNSGRMFYQFVQSFPSDTKLTPDEVNRIGIEFAKKQFPNFAVLVATHVDTGNLHNHLIVNSVSLVDGKKLHQNHDDLLRHRGVNDEIGLKYGEKPLVKYEKGKRNNGISSGEYRSASRGESYKFQLINMIDYAMKKAKTKDEFLKILANKKYEVVWTDTRKHITYTVPSGKKVRCKSLHEDKYTKEKMEYEFKIREEIVYGRTQTEESNNEYSTRTVGDDRRTVPNDNREPIDFIGTNRQCNAELVEQNEQPCDLQPERRTNEQDDINDNETGAYFEPSERTGWESEREIVFSTENQATELYDYSRESMYHGSFNRVDNLILAIKNIARILENDEPPMQYAGKKYRVDGKALRKTIELKRSRGIKHSETEDYEMKGY